MSPGTRHPEGGRKAKRAYAARPYGGPRDAGFYGLLAGAGMLAYGGGASGGALFLGGALWACWLLIGWSASRWLRAQEDFDSGLTDFLASPMAGAVAGGVIPALGALAGLVVTRGRCWWEPLSCAGLAGMAAAAPVAFLTRSFTWGTAWAVVGAVGGLGHPAPALPFLLPAAACGLWYLVAGAAQERAFRHFPDGPVPEARHLAADLGLPAALLALAAGSAWAWTPALTPKPVEILPSMSFNVWMPGEKRRIDPVTLFGKPKLSADGAGVMPEPSASSEALDRIMGGLVGSLAKAMGAIVVIAGAVIGWIWWKRRKRAEAGEALSPEEKRRRILRGAGIAPKKSAPLVVPLDPREAVIYLYNRLRADLAGLGIPRQEPLTPAEYARAFAQTPQAGDAPILELTELFHRAEYSPHDLEEKDRVKAEDFYRATLKRMAEAAR